MTGATGPGDRRPGSRDRERTRRTILDAAARVFMTPGSRSSLADIAEAAGVSKSGLLHHFASREELVLAVGADRLDAFRAEVLAAVDLTENRPGKLHRAYVRALAGDAPAVTTLFTFSGFWVTVLGIPEHVDQFDADEARWRADFAADGLRPDRSLVVRYGAEGMASAKAISGLPDDAAAQLSAALLALTED